MDGRGNPRKFSREDSISLHWSSSTYVYLLRVLGIYYFDVFDSSKPRTLDTRLRQHVHYRHAAFSCSPVKTIMVLINCTGRLPCAIDGINLGADPSHQMLLAPTKSATTYTYCVRSVAFSSSLPLCSRKQFQVLQDDLNSCLVPVSLPTICCPFSSYHDDLQCGPGQSDHLKLRQSIRLYHWPST